MGEPVDDREAKPPIALETKPELWKALCDRSLIYNGDRPGGFIEGWEARDSEVRVLSEALAELGGAIEDGLVLITSDVRRPVKLRSDPEAWGRIMVAREQARAALPVPVEGEQHVEEGWCERCKAKSTVARTVIGPRPMMRLCSDCRAEVPGPVEVDPCTCTEPSCPRHRGFVRDGKGAWRRARPVEGVADPTDRIAEKYRALAWGQAMTLLDEQGVPRKVKWTGAEMTLGLADRIRLLIDPDLDLAGGRPVGVEGEAETPEQAASREDFLRHCEGKFAEVYDPRSANELFEGEADPERALTDDEAEAQQQADVDSLYSVPQDAREIADDRREQADR